MTASDGRDPQGPGSAPNPAREELNSSFRSWMTSVQLAVPDAATTSLPLSTPGGTRPGPRPAPALNPGEVDAEGDTDPGRQALLSAQTAPLLPGGLGGLRSERAGGRPADDEDDEPVDVEGATGILTAGMLPEELGLSNEAIPTAIVAPMPPDSSDSLPTVAMPILARPAADPGQAGSSPAAARGTESRVRLGSGAMPAIGSSPAATAGASAPSGEQVGHVPRAVTPARDSAAAGPASAARGPSATGIAGGAWRTGTVVACRYRLVRTLGRGGMGDVVLAEDLFLRRQVALKTLHDGVAEDADALEAFRQEVATAHAVAHPGVARTFDLGQAEGVTFLSMEYLEGEALSARIKRDGKLPVAEVRRIGLEIAAAIDAAHQVGVIHRDLKPSNVQLVPGRGAVVMDFGIAAADPTRWQNGDVTALGSELVRPTSTSEGTPMYMAPEQWRGESQGVATDIYAFGAILFECLTGRLPFLAESRAAMMNAHLEEPPPSARACCPEVPPALDRLVTACLAKDPAQRPASMAEVARGLLPRSWWPTLITAGLAAAALLGVALAGGVLWYSTSQLLLREMRPSVARLAETAALRIDPADLDQIHGVADVPGEAFQRVWKILNRVKQRNPEVRYVYTMRQTKSPTGWEFVVSQDHEDKDRNGDGVIGPDEQGGRPGLVYDASEYPAFAATVRYKQPQADEEFLSDAWGLSLSGYAPVRVKKDQDVYLVGVDIGHQPLVRLRLVIYVVFLALGLGAACLVVLSRRRKLGALPGFGKPKLA